MYIQKNAVIPFASQGGNARAQVIAWMRRTYPAAYRRAEQLRPDLLHGLGDAANTTGGGWASDLFKVVAQALPIYQQQKIMNMQLRRAEQGQPPLNVEQIAPPGVPVKIGIDNSTMKWLALGVAGVGAMFAVPMLMRRKGRA